MQLIKTVSCLLASALALTFVSCEKEDKTISVEKIAFNETSLTLSVGQTLTPELTITPDDATDKTYILASSDEAVVTVSGSEIKAVAAGDAVITATVQGGTLTSECSVTVVPEGYPTEFTASTQPRASSTETITWPEPTTPGLTSPRAALCLRTVPSPARERHFSLN